MSLPYLTADHRGLRAVFKARWEDFEVEELPRIEPEGAGDHLWLEIEKRGLATPRAVSEVARALGVKPSSVGYAGMKDARAVARQWLSVEHVEPARALALDNPRITVLRAERHPRKLRRGWHSGNRFVIRLRAGSGAGSTPSPPSRPGDDPGEAAVAAGSDLRRGAELGDWGMVDGSVDPLEHVRDILEQLEALGVPNYYGPQRFGTRGDTWRVGRALAREEWDRAAGLIAGRPLYPDEAAVDPAAGVFPDSGDILRARELFDEGRYAEAAEAWPRGFGQCARLAEAMERTGGDAERAIPVVGKRMLRLYASAYQSWLFNAVLAERIRDGSMAGVLAGDLAWKHDTEALFLVEDPAAEQPRVEAFEISPTGPLVGKRMREPRGSVTELESRVIEAAGLRQAALESRAMAPLTGRRRPLRFALSEVGVDADSDEHGPYLELRFALPPGCYATAVLRELGKGGIMEGASAGPG